MMESAYYSSPESDYLRPQTLYSFLDENGFLADREDWSPEVAQMLAALNEVEALDDNHWPVIYYLRDYHRRFGAVPLMRRVCRENHTTRESIKSMFGSCITAWRIAGLPDPGEEAKAHMA